MSARNSSRKVKSTAGSGMYPPHMQSSLSPQGFGLYNSNGGVEDPTSLASGMSSPLTKQSIPWKDYDISKVPQQDFLNAAGDGHWNATGNGNFTTHNNAAGGGSSLNGVGESGTTVASARGVDCGFGGSFPQPQQLTLSHSMQSSSIQHRQQNPSYDTPSSHQRIQYPTVDPTSRATGPLGHNDSRLPPQSSIAPAKYQVNQSHQSNTARSQNNSYDSSITSGNRENQWVMPSMFDGGNSSQEIINSFASPPSYSSRSDLDTLRNPNGKALVKSQLQSFYQNNNANVDNSSRGSRTSRSETTGLDRDQKKDRLIDSLSNSDMITCLPGFKKRPSQIQSARPIWPQKFGDDRFNDKVAHQKAQHDMSYNVNSSSPLSTLRGATVSSAYSRSSPGSLSPILTYHDSDDVSSPTDRNPSLFNTNRSRSDRPSSPISRAKAAIGRAHSEISKMNSFVEEDEDRKRCPGAWKNMGTPFSSEPQTKSAQRQQKAQYRLDLERQILASKMRKAEEERKEKDNNDHPLGPEYAHPALTYYNPPNRAADQGGRPPATAAAALTKFIKEKYALDVPSANTMAATSGFPQETGGSTTAFGRIAPLQQAKKEKALANLMKSRMHPRDQNQSNTSRLHLMNQLQTGGAKPHNGMMMMQAGNGSRLPQQYQQQQNLQQPQPYGHPSLHGRPPHPGFPHQYFYPPGTYPPRLGAVSPWPMPMPMYPASYATPYGPLNPYGQPSIPSVNRGAQVNPQPTGQQQQNYSHSPPQPTQPGLQQILHDPRNSIHHLSPHAYQSQQQNYLEGQQSHKFSESAPGPGQVSCNLPPTGEDDDDDDEDLDLDFEALKETTCSNQKIWQTSDELPDPELRTAIYKAELRKQIDEDRKRKAERLAREKEEEERIERKIREFQEEERRRMAIEQQTRAELEGYRQSKNERLKRNQALAIITKPERGRDQDVNVRPRSRSSLLARKLARYGPEAGDFKEEPFEQDDSYANNMLLKYDEEEYREERYPPAPSLVPAITGSIHPLRKSSPPVPVVQKKLIENLYIEDNRENNLRHQLRSEGSNFLLELKSKLSSERDLVERRLREKLESTHRNMNLLKYTMNHK